MPLAVFRKEPRGRFQRLCCHQDTVLQCKKFKCGEADQAPNPVEFAALRRPVSSGSASEHDIGVKFV